MTANFYARSYVNIAALCAIVVAATSAAQARSGNYLIVTAPEYDDSAPLNQFISAKTAQGFTVSTYVVPSGTSNTAIQAYIQDLWDGPDAPDYILIAGDTSGSSSTVNTIPHWTGVASRHACTDVYYACMDSGDDWYPEIPIGRFSANSVSMLQDIVDKSLYVEAGAFSDPSYAKRAAFLATSDETSGAEQTHDWVIDNLLTPADFTSTKIYANNGGGTVQVTNAVNHGCLFVVYGGHSSSSGWSEPSFYQNNVTALTNQDMYALVFGWSCNSAHYSNNECYGETWQRVADRGAAAYLSASDLIFWGSWDAWEPARQLETYFFRTMFEDQVWEVGVAWHHTRYKLLLDYGAWDGNHEHPPTQNEDVCRNFFEEFILLGDPSLLLPGGDAYTLESNPVQQNVCSAVEDQAQYDLILDKIGDFAEKITLSCEGQPADALVNFSVQEHAPPFSSTLTFSNLMVCTPGEYKIVVTGTTNALVRQVEILLHLGNDAPGVVTLALPENGAEEVSRTPAFEWTHADQAAQYEIQIAEDVGFANIVDQAVVPDVSYTPAEKLEADAIHYWRVRAVNGCNVGDYSAPFAFTTLVQPDYFTEQFDEDFDIEGRTVAFIPDGTGDYYEICGREVEEFNTDPSGGSIVNPGEDGSVLVTLTGGAALWFYGQEYNSFHINGNGHLTFDGPDSIWQETLEIHFSRPRIAGIYDDFSPQFGGTISWKQLDDRVAVTYDKVPEYGSNNKNTFQIEIFFDGEIHLTWLDIDAEDGIVGLSAGAGYPDDFIESDLSAAAPCEQDFNLNVEPTVQAVCSPDAADYVIQIQPIQSFDEPVTLSVIGLPAGASVDFSVNPVTPPGVSTMTVSDTHLAAAGDYALEIVGVAASSTKSRFVDLSILHAPPAQIALLSPANAETNVDVLPLLSWQPHTDADEYDLQIARDSGFVDVVYVETVVDASHLVADRLDGASTYFWRVRGLNLCGPGDYSITFSFTTENRIMPLAYDMLNGEQGSFAYFDDAYDGDGENDVELAPLSNGLGDLTDGVIAVQHWVNTPIPYVGWASIDPTITFHFDGDVHIDAVILYLDDASGGGGVAPPDDVTVTMDGAIRNFDCSDPAGDEPFAFVMENLDLSGDTLELKLADYNSNRYMMLSEVAFLGYPQTTCPGDLNGDDFVNLSDLAQLLGNYGLTSGAAYEDGDLDYDGDVDLGDLAALLALYGTSCP